jgi:2-dehydro-3-deoxy-D-arabinonate dehydratase
MATHLFRIRLPDGTVRLARGDSAERAEEMLPPDASLDQMLSGSAHDFAAALESMDGVGAPPDGARLLAPIESQEVWAAGVTYLRSRIAREQESAHDASVYDRVYEADRPELFFKSAGWRVRGPHEPIAVRFDSSWSVPEPEIVLCLAADLTIAGLTVGNDVSSRSIEGENPLYLPQAKIYDGSCALGPCIVPYAGQRALSVHLTVVRRGSVVAEGEASSGQLKRTFGELADCLGAALTFPVGVFLFTGTGIVPADTFTLEPGDIARIEVDGIGVLENSVVCVGGGR